MARLLFSKGFLQKFRLHAHLGKHLLETPVLILKRLHLADHGRIHPAILRPPLVERCQSASNIEQVTAFNIEQFGR